MDGHIECVKLLIPVSDYQLTLHCLNNEKDRVFLQTRIAEYEAERLLKTIEPIDNNKHTTVKRKT